VEDMSPKAERRSGATRNKNLPSFTSSDWSLRRYSNEGSKNMVGEGRTPTKEDLDYEQTNHDRRASGRSTPFSETSSMCSTPGVGERRPAGSQPKGAKRMDAKGRLLMALTDLIPKDAQQLLLRNLALHRTDHKDQLAQLMATHVLNASDRMSRNRILTVVELQTFLQGDSPFRIFYKWLMEGSMARFRSFDPDQNGALGQPQLEAACRQFLLQLSSSHGVAPVDEPEGPAPSPWTELHSPPYIEGPNTQSLTDFGLFFRQPSTPLSRAGTRAACKRPRISRAACRTPMPVTPEHRAQFGDRAQSVPPIISCPQTPQPGAGEDLALHGAPVTDTSMWLPGSTKLPKGSCQVDMIVPNQSPPRACKINLRNPWATFNQPLGEDSFRSAEAAQGHTFGDDVTNDAYAKQSFSPSRGGKRLDSPWGDQPYLPDQLFVPDLQAAGRSQSPFGYRGDTPYSPSPFSPGAAGSFGSSQLQSQALKPLKRKASPLSLKRMARASRASMISLSHTIVSYEMAQDILSPTPEPTDRSHHLDGSEETEGAEGTNARASNIYQNALTKSRSTLAEIEADYADEAAVVAAPEGFGQLLSGGVGNLRSALRKSLSKTSEQMNRSNSKVSDKR